MLAFISAVVAAAIMFIIIICQNLHAYLIIAGPIWIISFAYAFMKKKREKFILQMIINSYRWVMCLP